MEGSGDERWILIDGVNSLFMFTVFSTILGVKLSARSERIYSKTKNSN